MEEGNFSFDVTIPVTGDPDASPFTFTVSGFADGEPVISIADADGDIASGGSDDYGTVAAGEESSVSYTVTNNGTATLSLGTSVLITLDNIAASRVAIPSSDANIAPGGTGTLEVFYTPRAAGPFSATLRVSSNDSDLQSYLIDISGTATGDAAIGLVSADNEAVENGGTGGLGVINAGDQTTAVFTVNNTGLDVLNLTGTATIGDTTNADNVTVSAYGSPTLATETGTTTFSVTFTAPRAGPVSIGLTVASDDPDDGAFSFTGTAIAAGEPDVTVSSSVSGSLTNGGTDAQGSQTVGVEQTVTYTVTNTGFDSLALQSGPSVSNIVNVDGTPDVGGYSVSSLDVDENLTFDVSYTPTAAGPFSFDLLIPNADGDVPSFAVTVSGVAELAPEIEVTSSETGDVENGEEDTVSSSPAPGTLLTVTYTIRNFGTAPLVLDLPSLTTSLSNIFNVTVISIDIGTTVIEPGQSTTVTITYRPLEVGAFGFNLTLVNDDADEGEFTIPLRGVAVDDEAPSLTISGPSDAQIADFTITIEASEDITGFSVADFAIEGGTIGGLTGTGASYTATVTPTLGETVTISIPAGGLTDIAGNPNLASNTYTVQAGEDSSQFAANLADIQLVIEQEARRNIRNEINANTNMMDQLLDGFISRSQGGETQSVPFDVDGNITISGRNMTTRGTFFGLNAEGDARRYTLGQFNMARDENGSVTGQLSGRYAVEYDVDDTLSAGYFVGLGFGSSELNGTFTGDVSSVNATVGGFGLKQLGENLFLSGYGALGYTQSDISMTNGTLELDGTYDSTNVYAGIKLAGTVAMDGFEVRPTVSLDYGSSDIGVAAFDATAFGLTSIESADFGRVSVADLTITPEIHISMAEGSAVFAPSLVCRSESGSSGTTEACGYGLGVNYTSEDDRFSIGFNYKNVEGDEDISINALYELEF